jgi:hypothetical protein
MMRSLLQLVWQYKWWWIPPIGLMIVLFIVLLVFSDVTGDQPFDYIIF